MRNEVPSCLRSESLPDTGHPFDRLEERPEYSLMGVAVEGVCFPSVQRTADPPIRKTKLL